MTQRLEVHPQNPQPRLIKRAAEVVREGGVIAYPTDSTYAFGCGIAEKEALDRILRLRRLDERHNLTLVCRDLSEIATYARVGNPAYRMLRSLTPGPYTFLLKATREVPRRLQHAKRSTIGIRVPDHPVARMLLAELGAPLLSTTARLPGDDLPLLDGEAILDRIPGRIDLVLDGGACGVEPTTVIDLVEDEASVVRQGKGPVPWA